MKSKNKTNVSRSEKRKQKNKKKKNSVISFFSKLILILLLAVIITFCTITYMNGWGVKGALMTLLNITPAKINNLETINIALLGVSEDIDARLTDTIMICSYNPKNSSVSMLSIPRDTFVGTSTENAKGADKINALFYKNKNMFLSKVSDMLGVKIKHYAVVNNQTLIKIVDIIGGVYFDVPIDMDYDDPTQDLHIHLKKGEQLIDGEKAEQLLRFRHNNDGTSYPSEYGDNDFGRMKTQRLFIEATIKQIINIKNITNSTNIYNAIMDNIETNYNIKDTIDYIPTFVDFKFENIISRQLPGKSVKYNEIWFFVQEEKETTKLVKELEIK